VREKTTPTITAINVNFLLPYLLTRWCRVLLGKLVGLQIVKKFPQCLWNPKVHYRTQKFPPPVPILGQSNPDNIPTSHLVQIHPNIIHPPTPRSSKWFLPLWFPNQYPIRPLSSPIRARCPANLILIDFITRTILGQDYRLFSCSLFNLLHSPFTSSLLGPNIHFNTTFRTAYASFPRSISATKFHTLTKKKLAASSMLHEAKVAYYAIDVAPRFLILLFMPLLWLR